MLGHRIPLLVAGAVVAASVVFPPPAQAGLIQLWRFDERPEGLPAAGAAPAQTLASASASQWEGSDSSFDATVELGGVPDPATDARLELVVGVVRDGACDTLWTLVVSTTDPSGPAVRDGSTVTIHTGGANTDAETPCGSVTVLGADGAVLDRLVEQAGETGIGDPGGWTRIRQVRGTRVPVGHWATLWVQVAYRGADADGLRVRGYGAGVDARARTVRQGVEDGDRIWVPLRIILRKDRARTLTLRADPFGHLGFTSAERREVQIVPR